MENRKAFEASLKKEKVKKDKTPLLVRLDGSEEKALRENATRLGLRPQAIIRGLIRDYLQACR